MLDSYLIKNGTLVSILDGKEKKTDILVERGIIAESVRRLKRRKWR